MKNILLLVILLLDFLAVNGQNVNWTSGIVCESGSGHRLANIKVMDKKTKAIVITNDIGEFRLATNVGDTLLFSGAISESKDVIANADPALIVYLNKMHELKEAIVKENSLQQDIRETEQGYRRKAVFYTGRPHYYYLFLKPMTFIYENFKSEVIEARRFKRLSKQDLEGQEIASRFNERVVQNVVPLDSNRAEDFVVKYWPTIQQIRTWSEYDIVQYIKQSYKDYIGHTKTNE